jgi:hypothetical protein
MTSVTPIPENKNTPLTGLAPPLTKDGTNAGPVGQGRGKGNEPLPRLTVTLSASSAHPRAFSFPNKTPLTDPSPRKHSKSAFYSFAPSPIVRLGDLSPVRYPRGKNKGEKIAGQLPINCTIPPKSLQWRAFPGDHRQAAAQIDKQLLSRLHGECSNKCAVIGQIDG